jgi:hypothetical protein
MNASDMHSDDFDPVDHVAATLDRINNLVSTLSGMYNRDQDSFAVSNSFLMQSLLAVSDLVADGRAAVDNLRHEHNALIDVAVAAQMANELPDELPMADAMHGFHEERAAPIEPFEKTDQPDQQGQAPSDEFAQNYLDLLNKLTAAEVFAAEQQALSPPGQEQQLLPLLRGLREDFQKLSVA